MFRNTNVELHETRASAPRSPSPVRRAFRTTGAAALIAVLVAPSLALAQDQIDVAALTCGDWNAMDEAGKLASTNAVIAFVNESANHETAGLAAEAIKGKEAADVGKMIDSDCSEVDAMANLVASIK